MKDYNDYYLLFLMSASKSFGLIERGSGVFVLACILFPPTGFQVNRSTANFLIVMMPGTRTPVLPVSEGAAAAATYSNAAYKAHACAHSTCRVSPQPALTKPAS